MTEPHEIPIPRVITVRAARRGGVLTIEMVDHERDLTRLIFSITVEEAESLLKQLPANISFAADRDYRRP